MTSEHVCLTLPLRQGNRNKFMSFEYEINAKKRVKAKQSSLIQHFLLWKKKKKKKKKNRSHHCNAKHCGAD